MPAHAMTKHIAPPATAAQIAQAVGVTEEDRKIVEEVLRKLGYLADEKARKGTPQAVRRRVSGRPS